ncbi:MAG: hypothetical protein RMM58_09760 [Chloroflexota bacterium]|nr:hypothetical protein [Dehalococcoidia bacterium]MDW8254154.1 hypothetical protein [Chloroflexota bacterium]
MDVSRPFTARLSARRWPLALSAALLFLTVWAVYWGTAQLLERTGGHPYAYFPQLAEAFLAGRLWIEPPPWRMDLTLHDGRWYVPFSPLPALLLIPWVSAAGRDGVDTVLFSTLLASGAAMFLFLLLEVMARQGWSALDRLDNAVLTLVFAVGSVQWVVALSGAVWHVSQETGVFFAALAALLSARGSPPWLAGGALALAMLARPHLGLGLPLLVGFAAQREADRGVALRSRAGLAFLLRWTGAAVIPLAIAAAALLAYNVARFGSPFDFGYTRQLLYDIHAAKLASYGWFNLRYVPENLTAMLLLLPKWEEGRLLPDWNGMSLLLTTPALALLPRARRPAPLVLSAWLAILLLLLPLLTYYNTGYKQFGYRFSLDFMVPALVLLALAVGRRIGPLTALLIGTGIAVNGWGISVVYGR